MLETAITFAFFCIAAALALGTWRLVKGPDAPDRVLALDTLYVNAVALVVLAGIAWRTSIYFEAALLIALMGFVSTAALARYVMRGEVIE
ncbi:MAG: K+/H+ antiporter subunit F [Burkholderiales bacterium]